MLYLCVISYEFVQLLLEHQHAVAPDPYDPLHELLDDLGDVRDVDLLIGKQTKRLSK